ncbi:oligosaccharide flippase family protein [Microbacterium kunmingense]|uniref:oligosaccharide flippase family protein n=1 Tax=Microbacterium kunmingense TaxID=2915939 RepID=UPI0020050E79|nr:oligosaccharide flippase family protein [Microbacterium kunmingense]
MPSSGRGARHVFIVAIGNFSSPLVALLTAPLLAQALGAAGRGEVAAATAPLMLLAAALTMGFPEAVTHLVARASGVHISRVVVLVALVLFLGGLGTGLVWICAPGLAAGDSVLTELIRLCSLALAPALVIGVVRGVARGLQKWNLVVTDQVLASTFKLVALAALVITDDLTPLTAAVTLSSSLLVGALAYMPLLWARRSPGSHLSIRGTVAFGLAVWPGAIAGVVLSRLDQLLIIPLSSAAVLGVYAVAVSLSDAARMFNAAVRDIMFARQSARVDDQALAIAARISTLITLLIAIIVTLLSIPLSVPIFGPQFSQVPLVLGILMFGAVIGNPGSVLGSGLAARGRPLLRSVAMLAGIGVNVGMLIALVPNLGAVGAAIAAALANALTGQLVAFMAGRVLRLRAREMLIPTSADVQLTLRLVIALLKRR